MSSGIGSNTGLNSTEVQAAVERNASPEIGTSAPAESPATPAASQRMLVFPTEFRQAGASAQYPAICFEYVTRERQPGDKIFFPMPPGIDISDSMSFDTMDLGVLGDTITKMVAAADKESGIVSGASAATSAGWGSIKDKWSASNKAALAQIAATQIPVVNAASKFIEFGRRAVVAPNTNTTFKNSNIRNFTFKFKMVPRNSDDTAVISLIVNSFRENMYPESLNGDLILAYPGTWKISFLSSVQNGGKNQWIPQVYESFLTGFSSSYNSSTNMFHADGSPIEVDVSLSFQEVKALNRGHIRELNGNGAEESD